MFGIYTEAGYGEIGRIQAPTIGALEYRKLNNSIILPPKVSKRTVKNKSDLNKKYFLMNSDKFIKLRSNQNIDLCNKIPKIFYNRFILEKTILNNNELSQYSEVLGVKVNFQSG